MTSLTLYKGVAFDGVNSFPHITSKNTFDAYLTGKQQYSEDIHFNRIGEPILINKDYDTAIEYSYGCIDTGNKKYFIIPDSVNVNENNRVYMSYSVDWFTTLVYEGALAFGRAHLVKSTDVNPRTYQQSIQPSDMKLSSRTTLLGDPQDPDLVMNGLLISYVTDDTKSSLSYIYSPLMGYSAVQSGTRGSISLQDVYSGGLTTITGIAPKDVIGIWYLPYTTKYSGMQRKETDNHYWYEFDLYGPSQSHSLNASLFTDAMHIGVLTDPSGSVLYTVPYGRTLERIHYRIVTSWTQVFAEIFFIYENGIQSSDSHNAVENSSVLVPCPQVDFNNDTYANWASGMKGIEIEERRIQRNKALVGSIGNAALGGAIGASGGSPMGAGIGAIGGIASGLLSYGIDSYYESDIQRIEDEKYQLAQDTMIPGSFLMTGNHNMQLIQLSAYSADIARYDAEIANFGADCNLPVSSWTPSIGAYKFADVEIIADVPYSIKQNIKQKMMSGIKIVGIS